MAPPITERPEPKTTAATFITQHDRGKLNREMSQHLADATAAAIEQGKSATVTLVVTIKPEGDGQVAVTADSKPKLPQPKSGSRMWFTDDDGNLLRDDPRKLTIHDELERQRMEREAS